MAAKEKKFEEEIRDLETLVNQIDSGELTLEESISAFERGVALVKSLNRKLDEVERKVELLTRNAE
ncbi:MAG: exodeoxyribonuclease VII small subunit, partial [Deltaproteobacteria bacterium]|nr:exodeoxyribonuclease VII small subunit [Deltaproteobacteria bacterium]